MRSSLLKLIATSLFCLFAPILFAEELVELNMSKKEIENFNKLEKINKENELIRQPEWQDLGSTPIMVRTIGDKKLPTVIVLHGSGGTQGHHQVWAERIKMWGYNSVLIESFRQRGAMNIVETQSIKPQERVSDVVSVAKWIKEQPWSDGQLAMIGYSHGGNTVFETALVSDNLFKGGIAYYPYCHGWFSHVKIPIQLHLALDDDWNPASTCSFLYKGIFKSKEVIAYEYPNSHHGFDHTRGYIAKFPAMAGGGLRTVTYGSNKEQAEISFTRVKEFLEKLFN
jgi:dienelactone hydrolase